MACKAAARQRPVGRSLGRRRRRLYRTIGFLAAVTVAGAGTVLVVHRANRTETYRTGERHAEITRNLDREIPAGAPTPDFVDVTAEAGLEGFRSFSGTRTSQLPEDMVR